MWFNVDNAGNSRMRESHKHQASYHFNYRTRRADTDWSENGGPEGYAIFHETQKCQPASMIEAPQLLKNSSPSRGRNGKQQNLKEVGASSIEASTATKKKCDGDLLVFQQPRLLDSQASANIQRNRQIHSCHTVFEK